MNVKQIILKYLKENNFDGLFKSGMDCNCKLDNLIPCDNVLSDCEPGYFRDCHACNISCDARISADFCIGIEQK